MWSDEVIDRAFEEKLLADTGNNGSPSIHCNPVVRQQYLEAGSSLIVLLDISSGERRDIGAGGRSNTRPLVSENHVVWAVSEVCDVGGFPIFLRSISATGVFAYPLDTGETRQLSDYIEASTLLHDNVAVVAEGCQYPLRRYALFLD